MGYEDEGRRRMLTPLSGELVPAEEPVVRRRGLVGRLLAWRHRREPPRTFLGALLLAAVRLALAVGVVSVVAVVLADWLARPVQIGFYLVGACVLGMAFLFSAANTNRNWYDSAEGDHAEREYRVHTSLIWILVGAVVLAIGIILELT